MIKKPTLALAAALTAFAPPGLATAQDSLEVVEQWSRLDAGWNIGQAGMLIGDLEGFGTQQLVASAGVSYESGNYYWHVLKEMDGSLAVQWASHHYNEPIESMAKADIDGDGNDEIAVGIGARLEIWDSSNGAMVKTTEISTIASTIKDLSIVDVDSDGSLEAVFCDPNGSAYILDLLGDVEFQSSFPCTTLAVGKLDEDPATLEIMVANGRNEGWILKGSDRSIANPYGNVFAGDRIIVADLNLDGRDEIISGDLNSGFWAVDLDADTILLSIQSSDLVTFTTGDWDQDGRPEVIYGDRSSIHILSADSTWEVTLDNPDTEIIQMAVGPVLSNGTSQVIWSGQTSFYDSRYDRLMLHSFDATTTETLGPAMLIRGLAFGQTPAGPRIAYSLREATPWTPHTAGNLTHMSLDTLSESHRIDFSEPSYSHAIHGADIDADPQFEILMFSDSHEPEPGLIVQAFDSVTHELQWQTRYQETSALNLASGDLDGDGSLEIVAASSCKLHILDAFDGTPESELYLGSNLCSPSALKVANIDSDPEPELILGGPSGDFGIINGLTDVYSTQIYDSNTSSIATFDLDQDGISEMFVGTTGGAIRQLDQWGQEIRTLFSYQEPIYGLTAYDLDLDGHPEFVFMSGGTVFIESGNGEGLLWSSLFSEPRAFNAPFIARLSFEIFISNLDSDPAVEIFVGNGESGARIYEVLLPPKSSAHWSFDEGSGSVAGEQIGNLDAQLVSGTSWATGRIAGALNLDGINDHATVAAAPLLDELEAFSVSAWIKHPTLGSFRSIVDKRDNGSDGFDLYIEPGSRPFIRANSATLTGTTVIADNTWHHVVGIYDGGGLELWVDGELDASTAANVGTIATTGPMMIGRNFSSGSLFSGLIDDLRIFDHPIGQAQIQELFDRPAPSRSNPSPTGVVPSGQIVYLGLDTDEPATCGYDTVAGTAFAQMSGSFSTSSGTIHTASISGLNTGVHTFFVRCTDDAGNTHQDDWPISFTISDPQDPSFGLLGHWPLNGDPNDISGNDLHGALVGAPVWSPGWFSENVLSLDGIDDGARVAASPQINQLSAVSITAWIKIDSNAGGRWMSIVDKRDGNLDGFDLFVSSTSRLFLRINEHSVTGNTSLADGNWHHVAGTYDGSRLELWVDGSRQASKDAGPETLSTSSELRIGEHYSSGPYYLQGDLAEIRLYDHALDGATIQQILQN